VEDVAGKGGHVAASRRDKRTDKYRKKRRVLETEQVERRKNFGLRIEHMNLGKRGAETRSTKIFKSTEKRSERLS